MPEFILRLLLGTACLVCVLLNISEKSYYRKIDLMFYALLFAIVRGYF